MGSVIVKRDTRKWTAYELEEDTQVQPRSPKRWQTNLRGNRHRHSLGGFNLPLSPALRYGAAHAPSAVRPLLKQATPVHLMAHLSNSGRQDPLAIASRSISIVIGGLEDQEVYQIRPGARLCSTLHVAYHEPAHYVIPRDLLVCPQMSIGVKIYRRRECPHIVGRNTGSLYGQKPGFIVAVAVRDDADSITA
jgi:hypothetical protein